MIYLAGGFAFLTKGPVGPALLAGPVVLAIVVGRQWNFFRSWIHIPGILLFIALCLAWPVMLYLRGGKELFDGFVIQNGLYRFLPQMGGGAYMGGHKHPFWYYLSGFSGEIAPWLIALPAVGYWLGSKRWPHEWNRPALLFLASIFPVGLILLSIPGTKRQLYLLPLIAPLAATVGAWIAATAGEHRSRRIDRYTHVALFVVLVLAFFCASGAMAWDYSVSPSFFHSSYAVQRVKMPAPLFCMLLGALVIVGIVLTAYGLPLLKRKSATMGPLCAWMTLAFFLLGGSLAYGVVDGFKNLHYMTADLRTMGAFSPTLIGYRLDEVTQAIIPFDTGIIPENITDPAELERYIHETQCGKLLMLERNVSLLPEDVSRRLRLMKRWRYSKHRVYDLYEFCVELPGETKRVRDDDRSFRSEG